MFSEYDTHLTDQSRDFDHSFKKMAFFQWRQESGVSFRRASIEGHHDSIWTEVHVGLLFFNRWFFRSSFVFRSGFFLFRTADARFFFFQSHWQYYRLENDVLIFHRTWSSNFGCATLKFEDEFSFQSYERLFDYIYRTLWHNTHASDCRSIWSFWCQYMK